MPRKIRELIRDLKRNGFVPIPGAGKGSHRKFRRGNKNTVIISGDLGSDAKPYQEKAVKDAIKRA